ncbi:Conserved hypothetical protein [Bradyrhizobium sp. ORS 278]|uniref:hypothetical protein n=1 Tax=Bradyrhizobium sp. (strain ORS 278) TaxID=114615 RepID=UPI0001508F0D|nr:hypothetical protein [Bradyrhizobium sp. ORS 278]CAL80536.1 Conserved hypothetical protein [Bradyrhizobium sp. ORS 278]
MSRRKTKRIESQFIAHRIEMLESVAHSALSHAARRVLDRLEIEHANHGGVENGNLACTFDDFARFGIRRRSVAAAIRELEGLGFVQVTQRGRRAAGDFYMPSRYRLTYLFTKHSGPTDEWKRVSTQTVAAIKNRNPGAKKPPAPRASTPLKPT